MGSAEMYTIQRGVFPSVSLPPTYLKNSSSTKEEGDLSEGIACSVIICLS